VLANRRVTDCAQSASPIEALHRRAEDFVLGDSDLAWARTTPWRSLLASALDAVRCTPESATVSAEAGNPSAALLAGWIGARLDIPTTVEDSSAPGISAAELRTTAEGGGSYLVRIERPDGRSATLSRGSEQPRALPLPRRELGDSLAEELRRMDPDFVYAEALARATGTTIAGGPRVRTLVWRDPARLSSADSDVSPAAS
jgi:glucose-6-phosphate dehydrogenase assembly protein OpcA